MGVEMEMETGIRALRPPRLSLLSSRGKLLPRPPPLLLPLLVRGAMQLRQRQRDRRGLLVLVLVLPMLPELPVLLALLAPLLRRPRRVRRQRVVAGGDKGGSRSGLLEL